MDPLRKDVAFGEALKFAERVCKVPRERVVGRSRSPEVARARHLAIYLIRRFTDASTPEIARLFGRDHTTVLNSIRVVEDGRRRDLPIAKLAAEGDAWMVNASKGETVERATANDLYLRGMRDGRDSAATHLESLARNHTTTVANAMTQAALEIRQFAARYDVKRHLAVHAKEEVFGEAKRGEADDGQGDWGGEPIP
jgi:hypothetical protein